MTAEKLSVLSKNLENHEKFKSFIKTLIKKFYFFTKEHDHLVKIEIFQAKICLYQ